MPAFLLALGILFVTPDRTLVLNGDMDERVEPIAAAVTLMALRSRDPIDIILNSPGGSVREGEGLISAIEFAKRLGVQVRCIDVKYVGSMAFMTWMHCSKRYALQGATMMFHYPWKTVQHESSAGLRSEADDLEQTERAFEDDLVLHLHAPRSLVRKHMKAETTWTATELVTTFPGFFTLVGGIQGVALPSLL